MYSRRSLFLDDVLNTPAVPGKNLTLSIDMKLQMLGERLMQGKIGAIVAIEPKTGEVLCMVSAPSFDPKLLNGRMRGQNHLELSKDNRKPLLNRAIMGTYPPGSTFKTAQALTSAPLRCLVTVCLGTPPSTCHSRGCAQAQDPT